MAMDIGMTVDVPQLATSLASGKLLSQVGTAVLSNELDMQKSMGDSTIRMMEQSVNPGVGANFDMRV